MADCLLMKNNVVNLMVQSPENLFVYWDMCPAFLEMATSQLQDVRPGLYIRLIRVESTGPAIDEVLEVADGEFVGSAYFYGQRPYAVYYAEAGLSYQDGFFTLLRSTTVLTPPDMRPTGMHSPDYEGMRLPTVLPFAYSPVENEKERGE
jgi:hypothetical protein